MAGAAHLKNREFATQVLAQAGLNIADTLGIIDLCKGLSVNDSFWAERDGENLKFADINLYDNPLDETLAIVAYTGYTSEREACDRPVERVDDGRPVPEGVAAYGTWAQGGFRRVCERRFGTVFRVSRLAAGAQALGERGRLPHRPLEGQARVGVRFDELEGRVVRAILCGDAAGVVPGDLARNRSRRCARWVFDALIVNQDRHANNHGFLRDNRTGRILGPAPLFDHNMSLFKNYARRLGGRHCAGAVRNANSRMTFRDQCAAIMGSAQ